MPDHQKRKSLGNSTTRLCQELKVLCSVRLQDEELAVACPVVPRWRRHVDSGYARPRISLSRSGQRCCCRRCHRRNGWRERPLGAARASYRLCVGVAAAKASCLWRSQHAIHVRVALAHEWITQVIYARGTCEAAAHPRLAIQGPRHALEQGAFASAKGGCEAPRSADPRVCSPEATLAEVLVRNCILRIRSRVVCIPTLPASPGEVYTQSSLSSILSPIALILYQSLLTERRPPHARHTASVRVSHT